MTEPTNIPSLEAFLAAPAAEVAAVAPATAIFAAAGTRRRAALERIPPETYSEWAIQGLGQNAAIFFRLGIRHLIVPLLSPGQIAEGGEYGQKVVSWVIDQALGPTLTTIAKDHGFNTKFLGPATKSHTGIKQAQQELLERIRAPESPTLWMYVQQYYDEPWSEILNAAQSSNTHSRSELVKMLYGADIPSVRLFVGIGRLQLNTLIIPPLLFDATMHCYWTQRAGFYLTDTMIRRIIYDLTFSRNTNTLLRKERYQHVHQLRHHWDHTSIIGVGQNMSGFWIPDNYPQPDTQEGI